MKNIVRGACSKKKSEMRTMVTLFPWLPFYEEEKQLIPLFWRFCEARSHILTLFVTTHIRKLYRNCVSCFLLGLDDLCFKKKSSYVNYFTCLSWWPSTRSLCIMVSSWNVFIAQRFHIARLRWWRVTSYKRAFDHPSSFRVSGFPLYIIIFT